MTSRPYGKIKGPSRCRGSPFAIGEKKIRYCLFQSNQPVDQLLDSFLVVVDDGL